MNDDAHAQMMDEEGVPPKQLEHSGLEISALA